MRKVFADCLMVAGVLGFPLAVTLSTLHLGSIAFLSILPIMGIGGFFLVRYYVTGKFFFEQWIERWPAIGVPVLVLVLATTVFCEVEITLRSHMQLPLLSVPTTDRQEIDQALAEEFPEFR